MRTRDSVKWSYICCKISSGIVECQTVYKHLDLFIPQGVPGFKINASWRYRKGLQAAPGAVAVFVFCPQSPVIVARRQFFRADGTGSVAVIHGCGSVFFFEYVGLVLVFNTEAIAGGRGLGKVLASTAIT